MANVMMVPIHLDALYLPNTEPVVEATADFSRLPHTDGERDYNPDVASISESIATPPLANRNLHLKPGVHLHWSLPDALTHGHHSETGTAFVRVPNRWLVTRMLDDQIQRQWIVESDYVHREGLGAGSISYPHRPGPGEHQPFCRVGRTLPLAAWNQPESPPPRYLDELTALGHGEATFAAFYPSCHSVFGLHDDDYIGRVPPGLRYRVIGWYSDAAHDPLTALIAKHGTTAAGFQAIEDELRWTVQMEIDKSTLTAALAMVDPEADGDAVWAELIARSWLTDTSPTTAAINPPAARQLLTPEYRPVQDHVEMIIEQEMWNQLPSAMICHAQLTFEAAPESRSRLPNPALSAGDTHLTTATTVTEALSARLAHLLAQEANLDEPGRDQLEDQLDYLQLGPELSGGRLDVSARFEAARHERGFNASPGGRLWTIRVDNPSAAADVGQHPSQQPQVTLPDELARSLSELNRLQDALEHVQHELVDRRQQIFADWYKYMVSSYPFGVRTEEHLAVDLTRQFIESRDIDQLHKRVAAAGVIRRRLSVALNQLRAALAGFNDALPPGSSPYALSTISAPSYWRPKEPAVLVTGQIAQPTPRHGHDGRLRADGLLHCERIALSDYPLNVAALEAVGAALEDLAAAAGGDDHIGFHRWTHQPWHPLWLEWEVELFPLAPGSNHDHDAHSYAPTYLTGNYELPACSPDLAVKAGRAKLLRGANIYKGRSILTPHAQHAVGRDLDQRLAQRVFEDMAHCLGRFYAETNVAANDRNPEWLEANLDQYVGWYIASDDVLAQYYRDAGIAAPQDPSGLLANLADFIAWSDMKSDIRTAYYDAAGVTAENRNDRFLVANAAAFVDDWWLAWWFEDGQALPITRELRAAYSIPDEPLTEEALSGFLRANVLSVIHWYEAQVSLRRLVTVYVLARSRLADLHGLSQALSGFNQALLMHKQTFELDIADPLAFLDYAMFTDPEVRAAIGRHLISAPLPALDFNPLRTGALKLIRLRLVDSFGQVAEIDTTRVTTPLSMRTPASAHLTWLPPRFAQPVRLSFRWLSSTDGAEEMNSHPASSPICGWLVMNHLDRSVLVYDAHGNALGLVDVEARWHAAPGEHSVEAIELLENDALVAVLERLTEQGPEFVADFMTAVDDALANIEPERAAQHADLVLLMSQPIAVVRASIDLELQGLPAADQGWQAFRRDTDRLEREHDDFVHVEVPVRLGECERANDSLVGYWIDAEPSRRASGPLYVPSVANTAHSEIRPCTQAPVRPSVAAAARTVTMLLDPRGDIHATSGVVPVKAINLPPDHYLDAMQAIEISFLTAPILADDEAISLPLPAEPGYHWSWLERSAAGWRSRSTVGHVTREALGQALGRADEGLWEELLAKHWLRPDRTPSTATIVPVDQRGGPLEPPYAELAAAIDDVFARSHLAQSDARARFARRAVLREGWLQLARPRRIERL